MLPFDRFCQEVVYVADFQVRLHITQRTAQMHTALGARCDQGLSSSGQGLLNASLLNLF